MGAKGHSEIWQSVFLSLWITYYQCCYKYPPDEPHTHKDRNLRMKKDMETLDTIVQSHLNAWVDGLQRNDLQKWQEQQWHKN